MATTLIETCPRPGCGGKVYYEHYLEDLRKRVPVCTACGWEGEAIAMPRNRSGLGPETTGIEEARLPYSPSRPAPLTPAEATLVDYQTALTEFTRLDGSWQDACQQEREQREQRERALAALRAAKVKHDAAVASLLPAESAPALAPARKKRLVSEETKAQLAEASRLRWERAHTERATAAAVADVAAARSEASA